MGQLREFLDLRRDCASMEEISRRIDSDSTVRGANLVILVMAIFIASVGLNMNSVAVIIGAMLVSPLMGGIVATGYGMATYDWRFIKKSMVKLAFQVGFALLASSIYFLLTPISTPSAEMISRTAPTIWDVIIALCGGIAGAVGNTRIEKSNVLPGVAIATALMPPLCTAGYGIAMHSLKFFGGAIYLFFINSFFIALSSYLIFKMIRVPSHGNLAGRHFLYQKMTLWFLGILMTVPSVYMAYQSVNDNIINTQVKSFITKEVDFETSDVVSYQLTNGVLTIDLIGTPLTEGQIGKLDAALGNYSKLQGVKLHIVQNQGSGALDKNQIQQIISTKLNDTIMDSNGKSYKDLAQQYYPNHKRAVNDMKVIAALKEQAPVLFPAVIDVRGGSVMTMKDSADPVYEQFMVFVTVQEPLAAVDADKLQRWIQQQVKMPVVLNVQLTGSPQQVIGNGVNP